MKLRLLPKLMLLILLPVLSTLATLSTICYMQSVKALRTQIDTDMAMLLGQQVKEYDEFYQNLRRTAESFAEQGDVRQAFQPGESKVAAKAMTDLERRYPHIKDVVLLRLDGSAVSSLGKVKNEAGYGNADFLGSLRQGKPAFAIFQNPQKKSELLACYGAPVRNGSDLVGVAVFVMPMDSLGAAYSDRIRVGSTGKCFVLDSKGLVLLDPTDKGSIGVNISDIDWIRTMLNNPKGVIRYQWAGVAKTCFYQRLEGMNWVVALGFTDDDLLAPIYVMRNMIAAGCIIALLVLAGIIFWIARSISIPLRFAANFVSEVGAGHMEIPPELKSTQERCCARGDEIGMLARGVGFMHQHLVEMLDSSAKSAETANTAAAEAQVATQKAKDALDKAERARHEAVLEVTSRLEGIADALEVSSTQLTERVEQSGQGATEQAARVGQTVAAMEQMSSTVLEVARNAGQAADVSADTRRKAEEGAAVVRQAVDSIRSVQRRSLALKDDMATLGGYATSISQVMGVISDIADQTNLLALNAAIEAARAGDAGRGFAVVADEVRKLAEKTMASTTDVGNAIKAIQQSATQNIAQVEEAVKNIAEATDLATRSGDALQSIVTLVDSTADQVRTIASASEEQSASTEEISQSIGIINTIAEETATAMHEASTAVEALAGQARQLSGLIDELKQGK